MSTKIRYQYRRLRAFISAPRIQVQKTVVSDSTLGFCDNPVFVMTCHRSGSSLLRRAINAHRSFACPPETFFLIHFCRMINDPLVEAGLSGIVDPKDVPRELSLWAFRYHEAFRRADGKTRWADKTPQYVEFFEPLMQLAPANTQVVVLLRDPFDIAYSIYDRGWDLQPETGDLFEDTLSYVDRQMKRLMRISQQPNTHVMHYEQLATEPEPELRRLCAFLDEDWDGAMMQPWDEQHNFGTEDPIARGSRGFNPSINNWVSLPKVKRARMTTVLSPVRQQIGYASV